MNPPEREVSAGPAKAATTITIWPKITVTVMALFMTWPAVYNGFPLLYPDSMTYITDGSLVARALFLHQYSVYYGMRSFIYSLVILPLHWNVTPWPIVAFQALIASYVVWLLVRSFAMRRPLLSFVVLTALLSVISTLGWYVSLIMPDILGPLMYLAIYLLVFAKTTLSRIDRWLLLLVIWWSAAAHITHLMLVVGLVVLLFILVAFRRKLRTRRLQSIGEVVGALLLSAAATMALHGFLYGKPSLSGERPPYLLARIIADGTGRSYLEQHCPQEKWAICDNVHNLPSNADEFLWGPDGVWDGASDDKRDQMLKEETQLVMATLRAYPRTQLTKSSQNFWDQLCTFGIDDFDTSSWVLDQFTSTLPSQRVHYFDSRQQRGALPLEFVTSMQRWVVVASLVLIAALVPFAWRRQSSQLAWLSIVIASTVIANALLSGTLSMVDDRYQARVIWMVPMLAGLFFADDLTHWGDVSQSSAAAFLGRFRKRSRRPGSPG